MKQLRIPATFMRGGTSNAVVFHARDLPPDRALWPEIFLAALGSPDPYGRQIDGMGGGISSLSKVCVVGPASREDADVDYTFAQIAVRDATVDMAPNCGNMASAIGPFAVDEGLVSVAGEEAFVRIHNTNTGKIIHSRFLVDEGAAAVDGDFELLGVAGTGSPVRLDFLDPGGASTGRLLPTGNVVDELDVPGLGRIEASLVDAANAGVFVEAATLGLEGTEAPAEIEARADVMERLEAIRCVACVAMGLAETPHEANRRMPSTPRVGFVAPPRDATTLSGTHLAAGDGDFTARMISMGDPHRALPLTSAMCLAVAARIEGTVVHRVARPPEGPDENLRILHPSGTIPLAAAVRRAGGSWIAEKVTVYRTQRRLFDGHVYLRASAVPNYRSYLETAPQAAAG